MIDVGTVTPIFDRVAKRYDTEQLQRLLYRPGHDAVLEVLRTASPQRVVDVACGTGILAARIKAELDPDEVHGFDLSAGMLAKARERTSTVRWRQASAMQLPLEDGAVVTVYTTPTRLLSQLSGAVAKPVLGAGRWPTKHEVAEQFAAAGFENIVQRRIARPGPLAAVPEFITIGTRPGWR